MKQNKKTLAVTLTAALGLSLLAGCGTNVGEHSSTYFTQIKNVMDTAAAYAKVDKTGGSSEEVDENALAKPANFTISEDGTYSFEGVENAQYYYIYIYTDSNSMEASTKSDKILEDGSGIYTGNLNDLGRFTYQTWNVRVVAYPDYENSDFTASPAATCDYVVSGAVEYQQPTVYYMWNVVSGELTLKLDELNYGSSAFPTNVEVVLTNAADANDVVKVDSGAVSNTSITVSTDKVTPGASYATTLNFTWDEEYVSNPGYSTEGVEAFTSKTDNMISGDFSYSSSIFNNFDFPHVKVGFDPENGGDAGYWYNDGSNSGGGWNPWGQSQDTDEDKDENCYFNAIPKAAENGAKWSYDIEITCPDSDITASPKLSPGSGSTDIIFGSMDIFADGTFKLEIEYQYIKTDMMNAAVYYVPGTICEGVYSQQSDGTLTLSYDHENAYETDYDIVTELTGKAAAYGEANPDWLEERTSGSVMNMTGVDMPGGEGGGMPGGEGGGMPEGEGGMPNGEGGEMPGGEGGMPEGGAPQA